MLMPEPKGKGEIKRIEKKAKGLIKKEGVPKVLERLGGRGGEIIKESVEQTAGIVKDESAGSLKHEIRDMDTARAKSIKEISKMITEAYEKYVDYAFEMFPDLKTQKGSTSLDNPIVNLNFSPYRTAFYLTRLCNELDQHKELEGVLKTVTDRRVHDTIKSALQNGTLVTWLMLYNQGNLSEIPVLQKWREFDPNKVDDPFESFVDQVKYNCAIGDFKSAEEAASRLQDPEIVKKASALYNVANNKEEIASLPKDALEECLRRPNEKTKLGRYYCGAKALRYLAIGYFIHGDFEKAKEFLHQSLALSEHILSDKKNAKWGLKSLFRTIDYFSNAFSRPELWVKSSFNQVTSEKRKSYTKGKQVENDIDYLLEQYCTPQVINPDLRINAMEKLLKLGKESVNNLIKIMENRKGEDEPQKEIVKRAVVAALLGKIGGSTAISHLIDEVANKSDPPLVRIRAIDALAELKAKEAIPQLRSIAGRSRGVDSGGTANPIEMAAGAAIRKIEQD